MNPTASRKLINVEMHEKMKEADFQNFIFPCCGLVMICKWGVEHNRCYGGKIEERMIEASAQKCQICGEYVGGVVKLVRHQEKHYGAMHALICALCRNPYVTKAALDCHIALNHGGIQGARRDYERKYKPHVEGY